MKRANPSYMMGDVRMQGSQLSPTSTAITAPGIDAINQPEMQEILSAQEADKAKMIANQKSAQKTSSEYFTRLEPITSGIANLDKGIRLLDEGADTGPISSYFPSFKRAAIELDQLQSVLGLDVIANTTFGALSKGELDLALSTAIPDKLNEKDLKAWMIERRDAQLKLKGYLEDAAVYLSKPGNTQASFIESRRESQRSSALGGGSKDMSDEDLINKYK